MNLIKRNSLICLPAGGIVIISILFGLYICLVVLHNSAVVLEIFIGSGGSSWILYDFILVA